MKEYSACFIVVGDVKLNDEVIQTAELLAQPAEAVGFKVKRIIGDHIPESEKYFMFVPSDKGVRIGGIIELHKGYVQERKFSLPWNSHFVRSIDSYL